MHCAELRAQGSLTALRRGSAGDSYCVRQVIDYLVDACSVSQLTTRWRDEELTRAGIAVAVDDLGKTTGLA